MKLSAGIPGKRPGPKNQGGKDWHDIEVTMSLENGSIEFDVPAAQGASALTFTIDRTEFDLAYAQLGSIVKVKPVVAAKQRPRRSQGTGHVEPEADNAA